MQTEEILVQRTCKRFGDTNSCLSCLFLRLAQHDFFLRDRYLILVLHVFLYSLSSSVLMPFNMIRREDLGEQTLHLVHSYILDSVCLGHALANRTKRNPSSFITPTQCPLPLPALSACTIRRHPRHLSTQSPYAAFAERSGLRCNEALEKRRHSPWHGISKKTLSLLRA